jgi:hypothetical protein
LALELGIDYGYFVYVKLGDALLSDLYLCISAISLLYILYLIEYGFALAAIFSPPLLLLVLKGVHLLNDACPFLEGIIHIWPLHDNSAFVFVALLQEPVSS